jgi:hypothetical protein
MVAGMIMLRIRARRKRNTRSRISCSLMASPLQTNSVHDPSGFRDGTENLMADHGSK